VNVHKKGLFCLAVSGFFYSKKFPEMLKCCLDSEGGGLLACFVDKTFGELFFGCQVNP